MGSVHFVRTMPSSPTLADELRQAGFKASAEKPRRRHHPPTRTEIRKGDQVVAIRYRPPNKR
jgi:hypothetical protein